MENARAGLEDEEQRRKWKMWAAAGLIHRMLCWSNYFISRMRTIIIIWFQPIVCLSHQARCSAWQMQRGTKHDGGQGSRLGIIRIHSCNNNNNSSNNRLVNYGRKNKALALVHRPVRGEPANAAQASTNYASCQGQQAPGRSDSTAFWTTWSIEAHIRRHSTKIRISPPLQVSRPAGRPLVQPCTRTRRVSRPHWTNAPAALGWNSPRAIRNMHAHYYCIMIKWDWFQVRQGLQRWCQSGRQSGCVCSYCPHGVRAFSDSRYSSRWSVMRCPFI